jgi:hypothetical protein
MNGQGCHNQQRKNNLAATVVMLIKDEKKRLLRDQCDNTWADVEEIGRLTNELGVNFFLLTSLVKYYPIWKNTKKSIMQTTCAPSTCVADDKLQLHVKHGDCTFRRLHEKQNCLKERPHKGLATSWKRSVDTMSSNIEVEELRRQLAASGRRHRWQQLSWLPRMLNWP